MYFFPPTPLNTTGHRCAGDPHIRIGPAATLGSGPPVHNGGTEAAQRPERKALQDLARAPVRRALQEDQDSEMHRIQKGEERGREKFVWIIYGIVLYELIILCDFEKKVKKWH